MTADDRRPLPPPSLHPDLDALADLQADVLEPATAERVRQHASGCARCTATLDALDGVGTRLRALPTPAMPAAVAARLDATLADLRRGSLDSRPAGPARLATPPDGSAPLGQAGGSGGQAAPTGRFGAPAGRPGGPVGEPVRPPSTGAPERVADLMQARDRRQRRRTRVFGAVAAAAAVLVGGASITAIVRAGTGNDDTAATAGAAADSSEKFPSAAAPGGPGVTLAVPSYDKDSLRTELPQIQQRSAVSIITGQSDDTGPAGAMSDEGRRTACANTIRGSTGRLQGVLRITYEGQPAYVFVFQNGVRRTTYVVSDDCGTSPALPAAVLDTVS